MPPKARQRAAPKPASGNARNGAAAGGDVSRSGDISQQYRKLDHREHVLMRPGMYVGSTEAERCEAWVYDAAGQRMVRRPLEYVPALLKVFDEVLMNAIDHSVRLRTQREPPAHPVRRIEVRIDRATGVVEVTNDGDGIPVELHPEHGCYVPELIFGHLLTSANYDGVAGVAPGVAPPPQAPAATTRAGDGREPEGETGSGGVREGAAEGGGAAGQPADAPATAQQAQGGRIVGGQNGIGAKACNIFSAWFELDLVDAARRLRYEQRFEANMSRALPPRVRAAGAKKPYTTVRFLPDYARFGGCAGGLTDDMHALMVRRVYDATAVTDPDVAVWLDGARLDAKSFERYVDLYLGARGEAGRAYERVADGWEVAAGLAAEPGAGLQQVSFVNGVATLRGGKHVDHVVGQIARRLAELVAQRRSKAGAEVAVRPQFVRDNLFVFVRATVPNPAFDSQTKETLTTPASKFGAKVELSDRFIDKLYKVREMGPAAPFRVGPGAGSRELLEPSRSSRAEGSPGSRPGPTGQRPRRAVDRCRARQGRRGRRAVGPGRVPRPLLSSDSPSAWLAAQRHRRWRAWWTASSG